MAFKISIQDQADLDLAKSFGHVCWDNYVGGRRCEDTMYSSGKAKSNTMIWHAREFVQNNAIRAKMSAVQERGYNVPQSLGALTELEKITNPSNIAELKRIEDKKIAEEYARQLLWETEKGSGVLWELEKENKALLIKLENQRIVDENLRIIRLSDVAESQKQDAINAENLRIKRLAYAENLRLQILQEDEELQDQIEENRLQKIKDKETFRIDKSIPLLASIIPISVIGLLLYTRRNKK